MLKRVQNFLFLLGIALLGQLLYILFLLLVYLCDDTTVLIQDDVLDFVLDGFFALAILLGVVNLFYQKFSSFIYRFSFQHIPQLHWYASFWGWILIAHRFIPDFNVVLVLVFCCIVAALCYPHRTWRQKGYSAFIFSVLWFFVYLGKFFDFDD